MVTPFRFYRTNVFFTLQLSIPPFSFLFLSFSFITFPFFPYNKFSPSNDLCQYSLLGAWGGLIYIILTHNGPRVNFFMSVFWHYFLTRRSYPSTVTKLALMILLPSRWGWLFCVLKQLILTFQSNSITCTKQCFKNVPYLLGWVTPVKGKNSKKKRKTFGNSYFPLFFKDF